MMFVYVSDGGILPRCGASKELLAEENKKQRFRKLVIRA